MTQRIALVTGGSRGLGKKNAALKLAAKGTDIILTYHSNQQAAREVVREIEQTGAKAAALPLNVGDTASFAGFCTTADAMSEGEVAARQLRLFIEQCRHRVDRAV